MKPLLVLVDLQRDFLGSPGLEPFAGSVVERAAQLLHACRKRGIPVVHVWTTVQRSPDQRMAHWKQASYWRCEEGTPGHATPSALSPLPGETCISKSVFSAFASPILTNLIRDLQIDTLLIAGVHLHACVRQTALDAYQRGLTVRVALDAVASDDSLHAAVTRAYLEARSIAFESVQGLTAQWAEGQEFPSISAIAESVAKKVVQAHRQAQAWRQESSHGRIERVRRLAALLSEAVEPVADLMAQEIGKPIRFGRVEMQRSAGMLEAIIGRYETTPDADAGPTALVRRRPHGVVAVITPWNNPVYLALGKIVPAVLFGNAVVWKPAPEARGVSRFLQDCFAKAGWPEGLVSLVEGGRREAEAVLNDPRVAAVTLTGSLAAGSSAQATCARRRIPLQAELGGNNAAIVWSDADLHAAAASVAAGAFEMAGQRCTANRRVIVHAACREAFLKLLIEQTAMLRWGDPREVETRIGPVVSAAHAQRVREVIQRAIHEGTAAILPLGEQPPAVSGFADAWLPPTILYCDDPAREIVQEETFGPVLVVQTAVDLDHAIQLCNGVRQGLAAAIFSQSPDRIERFLDQVETGILKVNQSTSDAAVDVPFGGWKASGLGPPEHGAFDVEFFTRPQTVYGTRNLAQ